MRIMNTIVLRTLGLSLALAAAATFGQVPGLISHQGKVTVGSTNYTGTGRFKFGLVNAVGNTTYWSNDGTSSGGAEPAAAVSLAVAHGIFSVTLGDTNVANMTQTIPASVFSTDAVYLRVWFDDSVNGSQLLTPDRRIVSAASAPRATTAVSADVVAAAAANLSGTLGLGPLPGAVVTNTAIGVTLGSTFTGNGAGLTGLPFSALPAVPLTNHQSDVTPGGLTTASNLFVTATNRQQRRDGSGPAVAARRRVPQLCGRVDLLFNRSFSGGAEDAPRPRLAGPARHLKA